MPPPCHTYLFKILLIQEKQVGTGDGVGLEVTHVAIEPLVLQPLRYLVNGERV